MRREGFDGTELVVDAGVLIAALDAGDAHHPWVREVLPSLGHGRVVVSTVTLAETLVYPVIADGGERTLTRIRALRGRVADLTEADALDLARVGASTRLRMPDAIVVYTALREHAGVMTTDTAVVRAAKAVGLAVRSPFG